jgi:hypothetical protein
MVQVWKMPINSQRPPDFVFDRNHPGDFETGKAEKARDFCFKEGWVGIGWGIEGLDRNLSDHGDYLATLKSRGERLLGFERKKARGPSIAFATRMLVGDFVWCRAAGDIYWLGKVSGAWMYRYNGDFAEFDLYQVRKCEWIPVGPSDLVPGPVKNAYAGRGQAISCIAKEGDAALLGSALIWESKTGEKVDPALKPARAFPLGAIAHDDLEDIVSLYLQMKRGWSIVPSTAKKSTPTTEFVLRNRAGGRAYVQVKSGQAKIESHQINVPADVDEFFLFYPTIELTPKSSMGNEKLTHIDAGALMKFIGENLQIMPEFIRLMFGSGKAENS